MEYYHKYDPELGDPALARHHSINSAGVPKLQAFLMQLAYDTPDQRIQALESSEYSKDYFIDKNDSDFFNIVSHDPLAYVYNIHRGTAGLDDVRTDLSLAMNRLEYTQRYQSSLERSHQSAAQHGKHRRVVEVGHSLGGTLAEDIGIRLGHESVAFNKGTTPFKTYEGVNRNRHQSYSRSGDAISQFDSTDTRHGTGSGWWSTWMSFQSPLFWLGHAAYSTATQHSASNFTKDA